MIEIDVPTRLMLVTSSYPEVGEGEAAAGSFVADFAGALANYCHVSVVCPAHASSHILQNPTLAVHRFAVPRLPLSLLSITRPLNWLSIAQTLWAGQATVSRVCAIERPDHILALWALPCGEWSRRTGVPYSVWALGSDIWTLGQVPIVRRVLRTVLSEAAFCFADGFKLAKDVEDIASRPCEFLASARQFPIRPREIRPLQARLRLSFLGRWHINKGIDILLKALEQLGEREWMLIEAVRIEGGGPLDKTVRQKCQRLRDRGRPVYDGSYLDRNAAADLLQWTDWLVLPSRIESIPVVFSDAIQAGCRILATPAGDLPKILRTHHQLGHVTTEISADSLCQGLREILFADQTPDDSNSRASLLKMLSIGTSAHRLIERLQSSA